MLRLASLLLAVSLAAAAELPANFFTTTLPADAVEVIAARAAPVPGAAITVRGLIGGRPKPFVADRALFTLMDRSLMCATACGTGWSGCSVTPELLRGGLASVQVVDAAGKPLAIGLEGIGELAPGSEVVVTGTVAPGSGDKGLVISAVSLHRVVPKP
jgi:hypothetical protein